MIGDYILVGMGFGLISLLVLLIGPPFLEWLTSPRDAK